MASPAGRFKSVRERCSFVLSPSRLCPEGRGPALLLTRTFSPGSPDSFHEPDASSQEPSRQLARAWPITWLPGPRRLAPGPRHAGADVAATRAPLARPAQRPESPRACDRARQTLQATEALLDSAPRLRCRARQARGARGRDRRHGRHRGGRRARCPRACGEVSRPAPRPGACRSAVQQRALLRSTAPGAPASLRGRRPARHRAVSSRLPRGARSSARCRRCAGRATGRRRRRRQSLRLPRRPRRRGSSMDGS
jgi:hypothetical protein